MKSKLSYFLHFLAISLKPNTIENAENDSIHGI